MYSRKLIDTGVAIILKGANYVAKVKCRKVDVSASGSLLLETPSGGQTQGLL